MSITEKELFKLSELSKLDITVDDPSFHKIIQNLNNVLALVEQLNNFNINDSTDIDNVEPMFHHEDLAQQRLRVDSANEVNDKDRELLQNIAPINGIESGLYLVPKVIEQ